MAKKKLYYYHLTQDNKQILLSESVYNSSLAELALSHDIKKEKMENGIVQVFVDDILTYLVCTKEKEVMNEIMNVPEVQSKEVVKAYKKDVALIRRELGKVESSFLNIGFSLHRIYKSGGFSCDGYANVYEFAKDKFGLARGTTNNFINVVETFGKQVDGEFLNELDDKYKSFSSSQLIALLGYVNRGGTELDCFTADMSVRDVKAKVKELENKVSDKDEVSEDGVEVVTSVNKEVRNVLISCNGKEDYDNKIDDIDRLICLLFAKSTKNVRIEIHSVEY